MSVTGGSLRLGQKGASGGLSYMTGMPEVMANLNREIALLKDVKGIRGMVNAAAYIRQQTEQVSPVSPIDFGNLTASWFVVTANATHSVKGQKTFKGPRAAKFQNQFTTGREEARGEIKAMTTVNKKFLMMGYGVNYAGFVHEYIGDTRFKREGASPKWLEAHLQKDSKMILEKIAEAALIKK